MADDKDRKEAVGILRNIKRRISELESEVSTAEGTPNLLRSVLDRSTTSESTDARENDTSATDRSTTGDSTDAHENDASATDRSTTGDSTSTATGSLGGWTWEQDDWGFQEWADGDSTSTATGGWTWDQSDWDFDEWADGN